MNLDYKGFEIVIRAFAAESLMPKMKGRSNGIKFGSMSSQRRRRKLMRQTPSIRRKYSK